MHKAIIICVFLLLSNPQRIFACSCGEWHSFFYKLDLNDVVASIKVEKYLTYAEIYNSPVPMSMQIIVDELFIGETQSDTLTVWGDNGFMCAPYLSKFPEGSSWFFSLYRLKVSNSYFLPDAKAGDYIIGGCADSYLKIIGENVVGYIFEQPNIKTVPVQTYPLSKMLARLRQSPTNVSEINTGIDEFALQQNYPNPFNPATKINYHVPKASYISIKVYDALGIEIKRLVNSFQREGNYTAIFDGSNLPSGIYIYRLFVNQFINDTKKMILMK